MLTQVTNLGALKFGKPYKFNFIVKNEGGKGVNVTKLSVGCTSCTKAEMKNKYIGPAEEGIIDIEFTPGVLGKNRKSVTLVTDDGNLKMEFTADVES